MYSLSPASYARFRSLQIGQSISMPVWRSAGPIVAEILTMCRIIFVGWATPRLPRTFLRGGILLVKCGHICCGRHVGTLNLA